MKEEIGRYAAQCGIEATQKLYSTRLNKTISVGLIRKFRRMYLGITAKSQGTIQRYLEFLIVFRIWCSAEIVRMKLEE